MPVKQRSRQFFQKRIDDYSRERKTAEEIKGQPAGIGIKRYNVQH